MNKEGLEAMLSIAKKQGWNGKPAAEVIELLQFSEDTGMNLSDIEGLPAAEELQEVQYLQYQLECEEEEEEEEHSLAMAEELAWYNHARMMGWE